MSRLEKTLPRGSWFDDAPKLSEREDIGDLVIAVSQLEADLTGVLGRSGRALPAGLRVVDAQFAEVDDELRRLDAETDSQRLRVYVEELRAAYREYAAERTTGD
ncbi:hypothetical protein [Streptomyces buecherae]|uniref:Uncharacterized protein n=1 Tax=Streptomyces buecherae TaxID=2763006 RepID=A0A7H8N275_9ACTN|nr:hypothetical protein [Streptomyces buecherae]QKW48607.1 hypothetical protein HUT08_02525 [Streptomyces buecherae]